MCHSLNFSCDPDKVMEINCSERKLPPDQTSVDYQSDAYSFYCDSLDGLLLICLSNSRVSPCECHNRVCNPATGSVTNLPPVPCELLEKCFWWFSSLVYDDCLKKYKVIVLLKNRYHRFLCDDDSDLFLHYTLGMGSSEWEAVSVPFLADDSDLLIHCVFSNGKLHYLTGKKRDFLNLPRGLLEPDSTDDGRELILHSLDIVTWKFTRTPGPPMCDPYSRKSIIMVEMNGSLYYVCTHDAGNEIWELEIWVLKDWNTMVWTKHHGMSFDSCLFKNHPAADNHYLHPISIAQYGTSSDDRGTYLIMNSGTLLFAYALKSRELRQIDGKQNNASSIDISKSLSRVAQGVFHINSLVRWC